jgi:hypothetical protein
VKTVLLASGQSGGNRVPVRNGLVAEYKFDECRNLVRYSQQFDNGSWYKSSGVTVTPNATTAPDGTLSAAYVRLPSQDKNIQQTLVVEPNTMYTYSIWWKATGAGAALGMFVYDETNLFPVEEQWNAYTLTTEWVRYSMTFTTGCNTVSATVYVGYNNRSDPSEYYAWGAQLEKITSAKNTNKNLTWRGIANGGELVNDVWQYWGQNSGTESVTYNDDTAWQGTHSIKVVTTSSNAYEGTYIRYHINYFNPKDTYTISFYIKGDPGTTMHATLCETDMLHAYKQTVDQAITLTGSWTRYSITMTLMGYGTLYAYFVTGGLKTITFWIDGVQIESGASATAWELPSIVRPSDYVATTDKQWVKDYVRTSKNLLFPNQANTCEYGSTLQFDRVKDTETISAETSEHWSGSYCLKVITPNGATGEGVNSYAHNAFIKGSKTYTLSAYLKGTGTVLLIMAEMDAAGTYVDNVVSSQITLTGSWTRYSVTRTMTAAAARAAFTIYTDAKQGITFYIDGMQLEEGSSATSWESPANDGMFGSYGSSDTNDPLWNGTGVSTTDDKVVCPSWILNTATKFTIIAVYRETQNLFHNICAKRTATTGFDMGKTTDPHYNFADVYDAGNVQRFENTAGFPTGLWNMMSLVYDGAVFKIYAQDTYKTQESCIGWTPAVASPLILCGDNIYSDQYLVGGMAYFVVYERALSPSELSKNYRFLKSYLLRYRGIALP